GVTLKDEGLYGVRFGGFMTETVSVEGNVGYINHFEFEDTDPESHGLMWDVNALFHFFPETTDRIAPFVTVGVGGLTALLGDVDEFLYPGHAETLLFNEDAIFYQIQGSTARLLSCQPRGDFDGRVFRVNNEDTFLSINYGGGIKAPELWGSVGLRFDRSR